VRFVAPTLAHRTTAAAPATHASSDETLLSGRGSERRWSRSWPELENFVRRPSLDAQVHPAKNRVEQIPVQASGLCRLPQSVTQIPAPWAREGSRFTLLCEALTLALPPTISSVLAAARLLGECSRRLWRVIDHHVRQARARERLAGVRAIGVDETARKRGQTYVPVFL